MKPKARVLASSAVIEVTDPITGLPIKIGEVDSFTATSTSSIIKSRPIGNAIETIQYKCGGYELSFQGGKVDWQLSARMHAQDLLARSYGECPTFNVVSTITHFDNTKEIFVYNNVILYGYEESLQTGNQIGETFKGYAPQVQAASLEETIAIIQAQNNGIIQTVINEVLLEAASQVNLF
jgi:hypothetical protein